MIILLSFYLLKSNSILFFIRYFDSFNHIVQNVSGNRNEIAVGNIRDIVDNSGYYYLCVFKRAQLGVY